MRLYYTAPAATVARVLRKGFEGLARLSDTRPADRDGYDVLELEIPALEAEAWETEAGVYEVPLLAADEALWLAYPAPKGVRRLVDEYGPAGRRLAKWAS